jgi:hypothetical protein
MRVILRVATRDHGLRAVTRATPAARDDTRAI